MTRVLVIDDEPAVSGLIVEILSRAGYDAVPSDTSQGGLEMLDDPELRLVISDIIMPGRTGFELLEEVRARRPSLPVLFVTGSGTQDNMAEALAHGAAGFITKPFTQQQLVEHVASVVDRATLGEREVRERVVAPTLTRALAGAIMARDDTTGDHTERLVTLALRLAEEFGLKLPEQEAVRLGAYLHDIGKIGIPDRILLKPSGLDAAERALMHTHTLIGDRLLELVPELAAARPVVRSHHERWDGGGYPDRLSGEAIPLVARLVAVADAVEAMAALRPYRAPLTRAEIMRELAAGRGAQWDPAIVDAVVQLIQRGEIDLGGSSSQLREHRAA